MNIKDEILLRIPYGYSKRKIVDDLIQKDFSREDIYRELESVYPTLEPIKKNSLSFIFPLIGITLSSLLFLIGYFVVDEFRYIFFTIILIYISFDFYRLKKYALFFWGVLFF